MLDKIRPLLDVMFLHAIGLFRIFRGHNKRHSVVAENEMKRKFRQLILCDNMINGHNSMAHDFVIFFLAKKPPREIDRK
jgi:hypothetical protein